MAVLNLQALVLRSVAANGNGGASMKRIGSTVAADRTSASRYPICDATPGYPPANTQPKPGHVHDPMDDAIGRAGRSGSSWQGSLRRRGSVGSPAAWVLALRTGLVERGRPSARVSRIRQQAQQRLRQFPEATAITARFGRLNGAFTASTRGESIG